MSVSLRKFRAALYEYNDTGSAGVMDSSYAAVLSADDDGLWWCSRAQPTGRETTLIRKAEHHVDAVFGFPAATPINDHSLIICEEVQYLVRAILVRDYGRDEVQVLAERTEDLFTFVTSNDPDALLPVLALSASSVTFTAEEGGTSPTAASVIITNSGGGVLVGPTVDVDGSAWLAGAVAGIGLNQYRLTLTPTTAALPTGAAVVTITVSDASGAAPVTATVTANIAPVNPPILAIAATNGAPIVWTVGDPAPALRYIQLYNVGGGVLAGPTVTGVAFNGVESGWLTAQVIAGNVLEVTTDPSVSLVYGDSRAIVTVFDALGGTVTYSQILLTDAATPQPTPVSLAVAPGVVFATAQVGTSPAIATLAISEASGGLLASLGTVDAVEVVDQSWLSVVYAAGVATLTYTTSGESAGTLSATVRVTSSTAVNSPIAIPVSVTLYAVAPSARPVPRTAQPPAGTTWNANTGLLDGSVFNVLTESGAHNYAKPTFGGATFAVTSQALFNTAMSMLNAGTLDDGDTVAIASGLVVNTNSLSWPKRPGWVEDTGGWVQFTTSDLSTLDGLIPHSGTSFARANRYRPLDHAAYTATIKTTTLNRSVTVFERGAGGYWFDGVTLLADTTSYTSWIVSLAPLSQATQAAHLPTKIVFNRCHFASSNGHRTTFVNNARYSGVMHSTLDEAFKVGDEPKAINATNTTGPIFALGNSLSGWGMHMLIGGSDPAIQNAVVTGIDFRYNYCWNNVAHAAISRDNKNGVEFKTGRNAVIAFNVFSVFAFKGDQQFAFLAKSTDSPGSYSYAAEVADVVFWCNDLRDRCGKGFLQLADIYSDAGAGGAIGCSRIEAGYNAHIYTALAGGIDVAGPTGIKALFFSRSQGNGIDGVDIHHNTIDGNNSFLTLSSGGSGWRNVRIEDNLMIGSSYYGPVFVSGITTGSELALAAGFGTGTWTFRRNYHAPTRSAYSTLMQASPYNCGFVTQSGVFGSSPFVNLAGKNVRLVSGHPLKGQATDGADVGADVDFLETMTSGVVAN